MAGGGSSFMAKRLAHIGVMAGKATGAGTQQGMLVRLAVVPWEAIQAARKRRAPYFERDVHPIIFTASSS